MQILSACLFVCACVAKYGIPIKCVRLLMQPDKQIPVGEYFWSYKSLILSLQIVQQIININRSYCHLLYLLNMCSLLKCEYISCNCALPVLLRPELHVCIMMAFMFCGINDMWYIPGVHGTIYELFILTFNRCCKVYNYQLEMVSRYETFTCLYIYIYIYMCVCVCVYWENPSVVLV